MTRAWLLRVVFPLLVVLPLLPACADSSAEFKRWLSQFRQHALSEGISPTVVKAALADLTLDETVIRLDQKQPESQIEIEEYLEKTVTARRVRLGKAALREHRAVLAEISARYHVEPKYLVALWGIESDYSAVKGHFSVVRSLATLAYDGRRRDFFSDELMNALRIMSKEHIAPEELEGSWAGAMGGCQFMPSTYLKYAVDGDGNGTRDIWNSTPDIFASIANYLHQLGWKRGQGVAPDNVNYKALMKWNRSRYFVTAVGTLADRIGESDETH